MYEFNAYPYASRRMVKFAINGMCATSQHLAAQAGVDAMKKGGNAIDAAIAVATALTALEPQCNGVGSDAFAIVYSGGKLYGLNASGCAPATLTRQAILDAGHEGVPKFGFIPVTVSGAPSAWAGLSKRFGRLPLTTVMAPAIRYAQEGQAVHPSLVRSIANYAANLKKNVDVNAEFKHWFETFTPEGREPQTGEIFRNPDLARTLQSIAETNAESFYRGEFAERMDAFSRQYGGFMRASDWAEYQPEWVDPVKVRYRGYEVWELPPNGQGIVALMALNILKNFDPIDRNDVRSVHRQLEAIKLAFADGHRYIADPRNMDVSVADLLSDAYGEERSREIGEKAVQPNPGTPPTGGTVYLCTADGEGNMVSYIQSNYTGFGSGLVIPGTGISLQNRGHCFNVEEGHPNCVAPRKRPYQTIIPGFLTKDGKAMGPFGVMGGFMQPQGHVQVMQNMIDCGLNPQACLDAPRWQWMKDLEVALEASYPSYIFEGLRARGHQVRYEASRSSFGSGQMIMRTEHGTLMGASEPGADGACEAW